MDKLNERSLLSDKSGEEQSQAFYNLLLNAVGVKGALALGTVASNFMIGGKSGAKS